MVWDFEGKRVLLRCKHEIRAVIDNKAYRAIGKLRRAGVLSNDCQWRGSMKLA